MAVRDNAEEIERRNLIKDVLQDLSLNSSEEKRSRPVAYPGKTNGAIGKTSDHVLEYEAKDLQRGIPQTHIINNPEKIGRRTDRHYDLTRNLF